MRDVVVNGHDFATTTRVRLEVTPGTAGQNTFVATITDFDTGAPVQASDVTLRFVPKDFGPDVRQSPCRSPRARAGPGRRAGPSSPSTGPGPWGCRSGKGSTSVVVPLSVTTLPPPETITVARASGQPDIYTITLPSGILVQSYADPGTSGANELHYTAFDASGNELPISAITLTVTPPSGPARNLDPRRLSAGHFVADVTLTAGRWSFDVDRDGEGRRDRPRHLGGERRMRKRALALVVLAAAAVACSGGSSSTLAPPQPRPSSPARLSILTPTDGEVVHDLGGAARLAERREIVPASTTHIVPNEGHLHVILDQHLISMTEGLHQQITGLTAGTHLLQVEFVASDHSPFDPRVLTAVSFAVKP